MLKITDEPPNQLQQADVEAEKAPLAVMWNAQERLCEENMQVSRGEGIILLGPQVIRVQVEHADHECQKDQEEDDHELEDILDRPA